MESEAMSNKFDREKIIQGVRLILEGLGEDAQRDGLRETPERVADFWDELSEGYRLNAEELLSLLPGEQHRELVIVRGIEFASICEHHLAPFSGTCDIAYLPGRDGIMGISKLGRLVDLYAKRLQVQERLTSQIATSLFEFGKADGVMVKMSAIHTCMTMRGIKKTGTETLTLSKRGLFESDAKKAAEVLEMFTAR
jgi:GTP cyclohydrolase I